MQLWCFNILCLLLCFSLNTNMTHQCSDSPSHQESFMFESVKNWSLLKALTIVQLAADGWSIEQQSKAEPALSPSIFPLYERAGPHPARRPTFNRPPGTKHELGFIRKGFISKRAKSRKPEPGWLVRKGSVSKRMAGQADLGTRSRLTWLAREPVEKGTKATRPCYSDTKCPKNNPEHQNMWPKTRNIVLDWCL